MKGEANRGRPGFGERKIFCEKSVLPREAAEAAGQLQRACDPTREMPGRTAGRQSAPGGRGKLFRAAAHAHFSGAAADLKRRLGKG